MLEAANKIAAIMCPEAYDRKQCIQIINAAFGPSAKEVNIDETMFTARKVAYTKALEVIEVVYDEFESITAYMDAKEENTNVNGR